MLSHENFNSYNNQNKNNPSILSLGKYIKYTFNSQIGQWYITNIKPKGYCIVNKDLRNYIRKKERGKGLHTSAVLT